MKEAQVDKRISLNNILFLTDFSWASEWALGSDWSVCYCWCQAQGSGIHHRGGIRSRAV
jgi:hypothetical protein